MDDKKYHTLNHAKYKIKYHLIFSTKYRKGLLYGNMADRIKSYMQVAADRTDKWDIDIMEIDPTKPNHIHLLVSACPQIAPFEIVRDLKQTSTYLAWKNNYAYMRQFYWKKEHHLWTRGYFCSAIGDACTSTIWNYIKNQG